jgi:hypothetical protein
LSEAPVDDATSLSGAPAADDTKEEEEEEEAERKAARASSSLTLRGAAMLI